MKTLNLKKGLRFTDAMRRQLALAASTAALSAEDEAHTVRLVSIASGLTTEIAEQFGPSVFTQMKKLPPGIVPEVAQISFAVPVEDKTTNTILRFDEPARLPHLLVTSPQKFLDSCSDAFKVALNVFATDSQEFTAAQRAAETKIYKFLKDYSSPKMLLGSAPDFAEFLPADWCEEVEAKEPEGMKSLADILA